MPTSEHWQIPHVVDLIARVAPKRVLDVGAGYGKYGVLAREYGGATRVDAADAVAPVFHVYDHVYIGDLTDIDRVLPPEATGYDLALFIDVIEHFEKPTGFNVLDALTRRARKVLVATPLGFRAQEIPGMPYETHRSGWRPDDFRRRYKVEAMRQFPTHCSRWLRIPKLWQLVALVGARSS